MNDYCIVLYVIPNALAMLVGPIMAEDVFGKLDYRVIWVWQAWVKNELEDKVNAAGLFLVEVFVTFSLLLYFVAIAGFVLIGWICRLFWRGFLFVFRKRDEKS